MCMHTPLCPLQPGDCMLKPTRLVALTLSSFSHISGARLQRPHCAHKVARGWACSYLPSSTGFHDQTHPAECVGTFLLVPQVVGLTTTTQSHAICFLVAAYFSVAVHHQSHLHVSTINLLTSGVSSSVFCLAALLGNFG